MTTIGEIEVNPGGRDFVILWKIGNFLSHLDTFCTSPSFTTDGYSWNLIIRPSRHTLLSDFVGYDLGISKQSYRGILPFEYHFAFKTLNGTKYEKRWPYVGGASLGDYYCSQFISRSELIKRASELVPSGVLTVVCTLRIPNSAASASRITTAECSYCKDNFDAGSISSHKKKCLDRPIKCPECSDVILLQNWHDHECQTSNGQASEKLLSDLKEMMLNGDHSDTTIKVKGEEFRLHKNILAARNSFFHAMFNSDMKEKATGVASIDDCEPDIFRSFIHFLYTGKVDKVSPENVCGLYEVAEKYQEDQLKKDCLHFIVNSISVHNFCNYIALALRHDEKRLLQDITKFFARNTKEIIRSVKWQNFLLDYPIQANELHIKALDFSDDK